MVIRYNESKSIHEFIDRIGNTASVYPYGDGVKLIVFDWHGIMKHEKEYNTFKGARIAMGRLGDNWQLKAISRT